MGLSRLRARRVDSLRFPKADLATFLPMPSDSLTTTPETRTGRFDRILSEVRFEGLKAIFERIAPDREALYSGILGSDTYEQLLVALGYRLNLTRQIHVQDCYARQGLPGGIKAVFPYHDIPSQSSLPTLLNSDSSLTTTPKAAAFFHALLLDLKKQLQAKA
jgi:hypothetical protein